MNPRELVLFVSHKEKQCGVYQFGLHISDALRAPGRYEFRYVECADAEDYRATVQASAPAVIITNHHPATMPWMTRRVVLQFPNIPQVGVIHEVTQEVADRADAGFFDFYLAPDPTLQLRNPIVFKTGRLVPHFRNESPPPQTPVIGSFGFGTNGKGFEELIHRVQAEFDEALIRLHVPFSAYYDAAGDEAKAIADRCRGLLHKSGVRLELSHHFLTTEQLLEFLASNSLNAFLYAKQNGRGISSVIDYALAVRRPVAVSGSSMFRHLHDARPSVNVEETTLRQILENGFAPLAGHAQAWTPESLVRDYERIVDAVLEASAAARKRSVLERAADQIGRRAESAMLEAQHWMSTSEPGRRLRAVLKRHPAVEARLRGARSRLAGHDRERSQG